MKPNGDWEPIDEVRAAWRPRVDLPHTIFEILIAEHMKGGYDFSGYKTIEQPATLSHNIMRDTLCDLSGRAAVDPAIALADLFADDGFYGSEIRAALTDPLTSADPAKMAWALTCFNALLDDSLPKNFWCANDVRYEARAQAAEDAENPAAFFFASDLCAYQRLQLGRRYTDVAGKRLKQTGHGALAQIAQHLYSRAHATMADIRIDAMDRMAARITAPNILPFRPRP